MTDGFLGILFTLYGAIIGSFLNVCIYRLPNKENLTTTRSHCMECGYPLQWYDLLPLISILLLKGRCRKCKTGISMQYPIVEALNGLLYLAVYLANGMNARTILYCLLTSALLVISVIDWRTYEIPPSLNYFIGALGVVGTALDYRNWASYLLGFVSVSGFLYLVHWASKGRGIGFGDVKLMAAAGLLMGVEAIVFAFFLGCIIGSVCHLLRMTIDRKQDHVLAFGPYLSIGIASSIFFAQGFYDWYLSLIL